MEEVPARVILPKDGYLFSEKNNIEQDYYRVHNNTDIILVYETKAQEI